MKGSIVVAMLWMFIICLLLFWLPIFGPLIAGFAGGRKAGGIGRAILAAILPAIISGLVIFFVGTISTGFPGFGLIAGMSVFVVVLSQLGFLLAGAIVGGAMA